MFDLIFGLGNILCVLAVCGLPIGLINPTFLKQKNRADVFKAWLSIFTWLCDGGRWPVLR